MMSRRLACLFTVVAAFPAIAQPADPPNRETLAKRMAERFPQPVRVGLLIGRDVLAPSESQPVLGHVSGVFRRPDGELEMGVRYGGWAGAGSRPIAIPLDAMALLGEYVAVLDFTPAQLQAFPTSEMPGVLLDPNETVRMGITRPFH